MVVEEDTLSLAEPSNDDELLCRQESWLPRLEVIAIGKLGLIEVGPLVAPPDPASLLRCLREEQWIDPLQEQVLAPQSPNAELQVETCPDVFKQQKEGVDTTREIEGPPVIVHAS